MLLGAAEGNKRTEREEYWVTITDFEYKLDLTEFICASSFLCCPLPPCAFWLLLTPCCSCHASPVRLYSELHARHRRA